MTSNRRVIVHAALAFCASVLGILACSSDNPPAADLSGGTSSSGASGTTSTSSSSSSSGSTSSSSSSSSSGSSGDADGGADADASSSGEADTGAPPACLDDTSISGDAGTLPTACPESASCAAHCTNIAKHFKVGVAQTAIACLRQLPSCGSDTDVQSCVDQAMAETCTDSTSKGYCTPLVTACDPNAGQMGSSIDEPGCEVFANALSSAGRTAFSDCIQQKITDGDCPTQVTVCASDIRL